MFFEYTFMAAALGGFIYTLVIICIVYVVVKRQLVTAENWNSFDIAPNDGDIIHILVEDTESRKNKFWQKYYVFIVTYSTGTFPELSEQYHKFTDEEGNGLHPTYKPLYWRKA